MTNVPVRKDHPGYRLVSSLMSSGITLPSLPRGFANHMIECDKLNDALKNAADNIGSLFNGQEPKGYGDIRGWVDIQQQLSRAVIDFGRHLLQFRVRVKNGPEAIPVSNLKHFVSKLCPLDKYLLLKCLKIGYSNEPIFTLRALTRNVHEEDYVLTSSKLGHSANRLKRGGIITQSSNQDGLTLREEIYSNWSELKTCLDYFCLEEKAPENLRNILIDEAVDLLHNYRSAVPAMARLFRAIKTNGFVEVANWPDITMRSGSAPTRYLLNLYVIARRGDQLLFTSSGSEVADRFLNKIQTP